jgi:hypothetical protein
MGEEDVGAGRKHILPISGASSGFAGSIVIDMICVYGGYITKKVNGIPFERFENLKSTNEVGASAYS